MTTNRAALRPRRSPVSVVYAALAVAAAGTIAAFVLDAVGRWPAGLHSPSEWSHERQVVVASIALAMFVLCGLQAVFDGQLRQRSVLWLEASRGLATMGHTILGTAAVVVAAAVLEQQFIRERWNVELKPEQTRIALLVAVPLAVVFFTAAVVNGRRWQIKRWIKKLTAEPGLMPDRGLSEPGPWRLGAVPELKVYDGTPRPRSRPRLRPVTPTSNVIGGPPLHIAYLRLFENQPRTRTFIQGAWRELGYVYLLRSAGSVSGAECRKIRHTRPEDRPFIKSPRQLGDALEGSPRFERYRGFRRIRGIAERPIVVRDPHGAYPTRALLCHGTFWKETVDYLLSFVDLVVLDLSGFVEANAGTRHELQRVVDRFPIERVVFLTDARGGRRYIKDLIGQAWQQMDVRSPNRAPHEHFTRVAVTDQFVTTRSSDGTLSHTHLRARRWESRQLAIGLGPLLRRRPRRA